MIEERPCPFCDGTAVHTIEQGTLDYRGVSFTIDQHFFKCNKCGEQFTTNELDDMTLTNVHLAWDVFCEKHVPGIDTGK